MPTQLDPIKIAHLIYDSFNNRDFNKSKSVISEQAEWLDMAAGTSFHGKEGFKQYDQNWLTAFPDGKIEVKKIMSAGESLVVELVGRGTHTGAFRSPTGVIPPTGKKVELHVCDVMQIRNGEIVLGHSYYDIASLLKQLGQVEKLRAA